MYEFFIHFAETIHKTTRKPCQTIPICVLLNKLLWSSHQNHNIKLYGINYYRQSHSKKAIYDIK